MATIQNVLTVGDTLDFTTSVPDYPASEGWTLVYRLVPRVSGSAIAITATASGDDYLVQETATNSAAWAPGFYTWSAYVELAGERYTVDRGQLQIVASSSAMAAGYDGRGHARKVLEAIEAVLENRATMDQEAYSIAGRQLSRMPVGDLMRFRQRYVAEVAAEDAAARLAQGLGGGRKIQVRL